MVAQLCFPGWVGSYGLQAYTAANGQEWVPSPGPVSPTNLHLTHPGFRALLESTETLPAVPLSGAPVSHKVKQVPCFHATKPLFIPVFSEKPLLATPSKIAPSPGCA